MKIRFCGAAREVTGSSHLITLDDGFNILLDCGLYQGDDDAMEEFNEKWLFDPKMVDCLVVSHAHIDHTGRIPRLVKDGFKGDIYATHATRDLCALLLLDSAKIQEGDADYHNKKKHDDQPEQEPLYSMQDAQRTMRQFIGYNYEQWFFIHPAVRVMYRDAGHILGSASVNLEIKRHDGSITRIAFTGDIGRPNRPILGNPLPMPAADYVICESTYGDKLHESAPDEIEKFINILNDTLTKKRGKVIIPAFSVGRTQELVFMLDKLNKAGRIPEVPVFVDSPLSVNATQVFINHPECFDSEVHKYMMTDENPFGFNGLQYIKTSDASKAINNVKKPCIIIASSGMMNAGRIKHHLANNIENKKNTFLIVGYCSPHTPGGELRAGAKSINVFGENKQVLADVAVLESFSAHGDQAEMTDFLQTQKDSAKQIWLVHGTHERQQVWQSHLLKEGFNGVSIPSLGDEVIL
jgi:metallo-beta-lactamase family protein